MRNVNYPHPIKFAPNAILRKTYGLPIQPPREIPPVVIGRLEDANYHAPSTPAIGDGLGVPELTQALPAAERFDAWGWLNLIFGAACIGSALWFLVR